MAAPAPGISEQPTPKGAERLINDLQLSWSTIADLVDRLAGLLSSLRQYPKSSSSLREMRERYEANSLLLLVQPAEQFVRFDPIRRSLEALGRYDREFPRRSKGRARLDSRFQRVLAQSSNDLWEPWRIWRRGAHEDEWGGWNERCTTRGKQAASLLEEYSAWARADKEQVAGEGDLKADERRARRYAKWRRQNRAVVALLEIELAFRELGITWLRASEEFVANAAHERALIISRAGETLDWLQAGAHEGAAAPEESTELVSPEERLRTWTHAVEAKASSTLPERVELVIPALYPLWRTVAPRGMFLSAFAAYARGPIEAIVDRHWNRSGAIVREVARAREIVEYWRSASAEDPKQDKTLLDDARHNAAAMLTEQIQAPSDTETLDAKLADAFRIWNEETSLPVETALLGWTPLLHRRRSRSLLLKSASRSSEQKLRRAAEFSGRWTSDRLDRVLESLGGKIPSRPSAPPVVRRTTLRDTLSLPASKIDNLPALYRSLFRLVPVEDRRFLVGRDQELAGLGQAVSDWEAGRFAACLIVGARGSGKTSLLNCAAKEAFANHTLVRGQFGERASDRAGIDAFLCELLELESGADLEAAFAAERRILVIEECERAYLRRVGGFGGVHHLIHLMHRTASTTLWVIGMNEKALRVVDAGAQFRRVFSHRINAMSVSRENLEKAIVGRHRLSGLRLEFAPPPPDDPRLSRVKAFVGLQDSAQKLFFDSLFQHSEGILRSAFELWLSSIDRVDGETLRMRQPLNPAFGEFRSELAQEDHFTLLAIQEHGSITAAELAQIFCEDDEVSRSRLDRLFALGLIDPDPEHPGLRIRPEAQRFTSDLLRRANLT